MGFGIVLECATETQKRGLCARVAYDLAARVHKWLDWRFRGTVIGEKSYIPVVRRATKLQFAHICIAVARDSHTRFSHVTLKIRRAALRSLTLLHAVPHCLALRYAALRRATSVRLGLA